MKPTKPAKAATPPTPQTDAEWAIELFTALQANHDPSFFVVEGQKSNVQIKRVQVRCIDFSAGFYEASEKSTLMVKTYIGNEFEGWHPRQHLLRTFAAASERARELMGEGEGGV